MKKNKIIALALAMIMSLSLLTGCSSEDTTVDTTVDTSASDTATTDTATTTDETEEVAEVEKTLYTEASTTASENIMSTTAEGIESGLTVFTYDGGEVNADIYAYGISQGLFEAESLYYENAQEGELLVEFDQAANFEAAKAYAIDYIQQIIAIDEILKECDFEMTVALVASIEADIDYAEEQLGTDSFNSTLSLMGISREGFINEQLRVYAFEEGLNELYGKTEEELYESYQNEYMKAKHILIPFTTDDTGAVSDEDYATAKALAESVLEEVKAGDQTFDELIALYNQDTAQPSTGYAFKEGYMLAEFEAATLLLEENEVSDLVEATYGFHIIQAVGSSLENYEENADNIATVEYYSNAAAATDDLFARMEVLSNSFVETELGTSITYDNYTDYFIVD